MKYTTTIILWVSLVIGELHTLFENVKGHYNWIATGGHDMSLQWNFKYAADQFYFILMGFAILFYKPNRINRTSVMTYTAYCIADMFSYFWNYKTSDVFYRVEYILLIIVWILIYKRNGSSRTTNRQGVTITA
jgi:hypothetical protein